MAIWGKLRSCTQLRDSSAGADSGGLLGGFKGQTLLARWLEVIHQVIAQLVDAVSDTLKCGEGWSDRHSSEGVKMLSASA